MTDLPTPSATLSSGFFLLSLLMVFVMAAVVARGAGRGAGLRAAVVLLGWMGLTGALAASGLLDHFTPPRIVVLLVAEVCVLAWLWRAPLGGQLTRLPLGLLVGLQGFRVIVELLIHEAVAEGIAPPQMTWTGWNFDILTGVSALAIAPAAGRLPPAAVRAWNGLGAAILLVVIVVAILSMPTPLRMFDAEPANTWVASAPFVWLPTILVFAAFAGHLLVARRLREDQKRTLRPARSAAEG